MKVFELAKKLNKKSKEILDAAKYLNIQIKSHLSNLDDDEVKQIIKYFRKRRLIFFFKKYLTPLLLIFFITILFFIIYPQSVVSGEIDASVDEVGELTIDWEIYESIEEGAVLVESESELLIIEIDESIGNVVECCFEEDLNILLLITDENDEIIEVESVNLPLSNKSISTTSTSTTMTTSTTTSTTIPECNDENFQPYTLYDSEGNANTVLTCRNEQDAFDAGFIYSVNPKPTAPTSTLPPTAPTTTTIPPTSTTTTTLAPTTTTTTTLGSLIDEIPTDDNVRESSFCRPMTVGNNIGKNKFQYQAVFTSDIKEYEYKLRFRFNGNNWKDWKRGNFKSIGGKNNKLKIRIQKVAKNKKNAISSFEYEFTYRNKVGTFEKTTEIFAWEKDIPCAFINPNSTKKSVVEKQERLNFTDDLNAITPNNTIPPSTTSSTTSSTTTSTTTTSSTTTSSTTTSTTIPEPTYIVYDRDCNEFGPYPIDEYNEIIGDGSVYLGYCIIDVYATSTTTTTTTTLPEPPAPAPTATTSTTTTTLPSSINMTTGETYSGTCYYNDSTAGVRQYGTYFTNNESESIYILHQNSMGVAPTQLTPGETRNFSTYTATHGANSRQYKVASSQAGLNDTEFITRNFNLDCQADIDITHSLASCAGSKGSRTRISSLSFTNNESETAYVVTRYSTNGGSTWSSNDLTTISAGATVSGPNYTVPNGGSIIWQSHKGFTAGTNVSFSDSDYYTENTSNTIDCPDGYYVNVDGSNTYSLDVECKKWNNTTKVRFRANPWWGDYDLAKDYMFALIALTGEYDNGDSSVDVEDYFDYSQFTCGIVPGAYFAYQKGFVEFIGQAITAPSWNSTTDQEDGSSNQKDFYIFSELVP